MSVFSIYDWITSLIRPRGRFKAIEGNSLGTATTELESLDATNTTTLANVELIPTLNFIASENRLDWQHVTTQTELNKKSAKKTNGNTSDEEDDDDNDDNNSTKTFIITLDKTTTTSIISNVEVATQTSPSPTPDVSVQFPSDSNSSSNGNYINNNHTQSKKSHNSSDSNNYIVFEAKGESDEDSNYNQLQDISLCDTVTSFFDEPTSSISIEMAEGYATGTTTTTTESSWPPITSTTVTSSYSTRSQTQSALPTGQNTTSNSDHSIEEEIEEAIEVSGSLSFEEDVEEKFMVKTSNEDSLEVPSKSGEKVSRPKTSKLDLFGLDGSDISGVESSHHDDPDSSNQFKIDDEQLSGGRLKQHFVIPPDDDEDDDDVNQRSGSLHLQKTSLVHSRHSPSDLEQANEDKSLSNQNTADDVSDMMEELKPDMGLDDDSDSFDLPLPIEKVISSPLYKKALTKMPETKCQERKDLHLTKLSSDEKLEDLPNVEEYTRASPDHSEKDHSLEEIIETNASMEMNIDDKNLSSSNNNNSNKEPPTGSFEKQLSENNEPSSHQSDDILEKDGSYMASEQPTEDQMEEKSSQMVTDLDEVTSDHESSKVKNSSEPNSFREFRISRATDSFIEESSMSIGVEEEEGDDNEDHSNTIHEEEEEDDEDDTSLKLMKVRILAMQNQPKEAISVEASNMAGSFVTAQEIKQMERVPLNEFTKDVLEDITEESERNSLSTTGEQHSLSFEREADNKHSETTTPRAEETIVQQNPYDLAIVKEKQNETVDVEESSSSLVSLNMLKMLEQKVIDLQSMLESKDACLASLQLQLESLQRRESSNGNSTNTEAPISGRDSSSLVTNSTEYRTFQEDFGAQTMDIYMELLKRDELITKLTDSLQQSLNAREKLQTQSDKLSEEVQLLRKQISDVMDNFRRPPGLWSRAGDLESNAGQRLSEISMDLVSESDDDLDRQFLTDNEDKYSRNSKERQLFDEDNNIFGQALECNPPFNKQIEQFEKYLTPSEVRLFHMVQKKFDDYLTKELEQSRLKSEQEFKIAMDKWQTEKQQKDDEIQKLLILREEKDTMHSKEMEDLRKYFENKCADLEKQFSDDVFSQKSQLHEDSSASECSDPEQMPEETVQIVKEMSPRKRARSLLLNSPSHRQMTPFIMDNKDENESASLELKDLKAFYQNKIHELQNANEEAIRRLNEKLKYYENRYPDDDFMNLLSETTTDDQHWPKELILLREKFTAKSQLEIAQLQIKHAEEMSRLKTEYEKQLNRKLKRNVTFDSAREFNQILCERDGLRELSKSFRQVLSELAKCVANCEDDLNTTIAEEVQRQLSSNRTFDEDLNEGDQTINCSLINTTLNSTLQRARLIPDVQGILELVENPSLVQYISQQSSNNSDDFDLNECLERLEKEASYLLQLSENLNKRHKRLTSESSGGEKSDSCCEAEDDSKIRRDQENLKFIRANSLNEQQLPTYPNLKIVTQQFLSSLPPDLNRLHGCGDNSSISGGNASELNFQLVELKNRLIKSESDRNKLQQELENTITRNSELGEELQALRDQLSQLNSLNQTEYTEGYGLGSNVKSPPRNDNSPLNTTSSFALLQEKARNLLSTPTKTHEADDSTAMLLQMIEDFCREGDKIIEDNKKDREDLQSQIDTADKQLKAIRQFLEEQAIEREQERDEYVREIESLKVQLRDKEKEHTSFVNASEEFEQQEAQIRNLNQKLNEANSKREKFEVELKASIDKIFVLREIISELETQVETKALNEHVLSEKIKQLEEFINSQNRSNETLQNEVQSLKTEIDESYKARICSLEEKLQNIRPAAEQSMVMDQVVEQLRDIENTLEQKTKMLESLHHSSASNSCSISASEDVSAQRTRPTSLPLSAAIVSPPQGSPVHPSPRQHSLTMEGVQRVVDKLSKHSRVEEAAIKRIHDLEMLIKQVRSTCVELQKERDCLQEHMYEQTQRISALQSRLDEQRNRAEELQRSSTTDLNIRIHDLHNEIQTLRDNLSNRDKQIVTLKNQLEKSKQAIDNLEEELRNQTAPDDRKIEQLEDEIRLKNIEIQKFKDKLKTEMMNKHNVPDLMQTMLEDKNEEIDHLKEQLAAKERELQAVMELNLSQGSSNGNKPNASGGGDGLAVNKDDGCTKLSARTLSDIVSITEYDEPDIMRKAAVYAANTPLLLPERSNGETYIQNTIDTSKEALANLTYKRSDDLSGLIPLHPANTFEHPHYFQDPNLLQGLHKSGATLSPLGLVPRQINFSALTEDSKLKTPNELKSFEDQNKTAGPQMSNEKQQELEKSLALKEQQLRDLQEELLSCKKEIENLNKANSEHIEAIVEKSRDFEKLQKSYKQQAELISHQEKDLNEYKEIAQYKEKRIKDLEEQVLKTISTEVDQRNSLRLELQTLSEIHAQCKYAIQDASLRKKEIEQLNQELKAKDDRLLNVTSKLSLSEEKVLHLQQAITALEKEVERLKQQLQSESSSRQFSVDEIAQQVEKELNYSAQLDSNILKAIESEEENNLDCKQSKLAKAQQLQHQPQLVIQKTESQGTDDENFTGERDLLNQVEALKAQIIVEREQSEVIKQELLQEKQHSQEIQEQDVLIIEAMRKRLETALEKEDELHKQLDIERERCDRLQTQLTALQRSESRRNSSLLLKSPTESPRKSPRSLNDFESELAERLKSEIKMLTAQNERERERSTDLQRNAERERQRFDLELQERIDYCERLKKEMDKLSRDKENAELEIEHLQERLTLQTSEIESLESRLVTLQEAETRRTNRQDRHQKESTKLLAELQEIKARLVAGDAERENLAKTITQLRFDIERSTLREAKLAEALATANAQLANAADATAAVPQQFLQKMKEINALLAENTQENRQMAETVQFLVEERRQLQKKCEDLESQVNGATNTTDLEERCNYLFGRYLRVESHRKALVYQKRYLKLSLQRYLENEQRVMDHLHGKEAALIQERLRKKKLFKTAALAIIAIQRMKYIGRIWHTGKRIVSKSVFTVTQQKRHITPVVSCPIVTSTKNTSMDSPTSPMQMNGLRGRAEGPVTPPMRIYAADRAL